nr:histidine kinase [uncultured Niameybacter sp.]
MSIKKKITLTLILLMSTVLICSYTVIYILFQNTMVQEVIHYQSSVTSLNNNLLTNFMDSIEQTSLMVISNQLLGNYLNTEPADPLIDIQVRLGILKEFSNCSSLKLPNNTNYYYKNTLFLNDTLPITSGFEAKTLNTNTYSRSYNVFSNSEVKNSNWYIGTLTSPQNHYVFINAESNELCFAKKIQNTFYTGPYDSSGIGVMVISIKIEYLDNVLTFSPLTPNSGYSLLSREGNILYTSTETIEPDIFLDLYHTSLSTLTSASSSNLVYAYNQKYVVHTSFLDSGLSIIFVTPYEDIIKQSNSFMYTFILFAFIVILLTIPIAYFIAFKITKPIIDLSGTIASIDDTRTFDIHKLHFSKSKEIIVLCNSFKRLITYTNNLMEAITHQNELKKQAELKALQAQINPHFIFNAMDVVNWIALSRNQDDIAHIVGSISNLMRYSITDPNCLVNISDEIQNIYEFISIYRLRHDYPIIFNVDSPLPLHTICIPKFIIQPLVENTIKHGIDPQNPIDCLKIQLLIYTEEDYLYIEISSNGKTCDPQLLNDYLNYKDTPLNPSSGFGIRNVNERIHLHFKEDSKLFYSLNQNQQLTAKIILPYLK